MSTEILNGNSQHVLSDDLKRIVENIAVELNFKDFQIIVNTQDFTGDNYLGDISRIKLTPVTENDEEKPVNLVVKRAPLTREGIPVNTYYKREIFIYTTFIPIINKLQEANSIPIEERFIFAKFYNGTAENLKEVLVLRDLGDDGLTLHEKSIPFDYEYAKIILQNLARLHACSFVLKEKEPEIFKSLTENVAQSLNYGDCLIDTQEKLICKIIPMIDCPKNKKKLESYVQNVGKLEKYFLDANSFEPYNVICHGDCWNNNMLFKYEEKVQLGELMLSLCYLPTAGRLTLTIIKGRNLKAMDITGSSDPYVKVYLICQGKRIKKKKTTVKKNTLCPVYNEALVFDVPAENVEEVSLLVKVIDYDRIGSNELMGCTAIGSSYIGVGRDHWLEMLDNPRKPVAQWYPLAESVSGDLPANGSDHPVSLSCLNGR